ncbi:MAG: SH3 domain-containing protein [Selenomonadaceae bacterium]|nr:SH3 domain-containing protein [Selenomonadaceae bacterium]
MKKFLALVAALTIIIGASTVQANSGVWCRATVVNCNEWISLRHYPSTEAPRLTTIPLGATVKIYQGQLGENSSSPTNGFYWTQYNGMQGWCLKEYIRVGELVESVP